MRLLCLRREPGACPGEVSHALHRLRFVLAAQVDERRLDPGMAHELFQRDHLVGMRLIELDGEGCPERVDVTSDPSPRGDSLDRLPYDLVAALDPSHGRSAAIRDQVLVGAYPEAVPLGRKEDCQVLVGEWLDRYL